MKLDLTHNSEQPLYLQLSEQLRRQMRSGALKPGDRLPSFAQLRLEHGIHKNTVEHAHRLLEAEGLIVRQAGSGTFVAPRPIKSARGTIGLYAFGFLEGGSSSYWMHLLDGINRQAAASSPVMFLTGKVGDEWEKVDGVLLTEYGRSETLPNVPPHIPIVCLFHPQPGYASVTADEDEGTRLAVAHLLELGHRRIAFLHTQNTMTAACRLQGYRNALSEAGITPQPEWRRALEGKNNYGPEFLAAGERAMTAWLRDSGPSGWKRTGCTALLCHNDETALGAMRALAQNGLRVPDDVSIVGHDGTEIAEYASPRLTSVEMPLRAMGGAAVESLQRQIAADAIQVEHQVLKTQLRVRESTAAPRVID